MSYGGEFLELESLIEYMSFDSFLLFYIILQEMKSNETRDTRGVFFVVADDLKNSETLKSEASRRVIFTILRHFQLIREIRGPLSLVRYAAVV